MSILPKINLSVETLKDILCTYCCYNNNIRLKFMVFRWSISNYHRTQYVEGTLSKTVQLYPSRTIINGITLVLNRSTVLTLYSPSHGVKPPKRAIDGRGLRRETSNQQPLQALLLWQHKLYDTRKPHRHSNTRTRDHGNNGRHDNLHRHDAPHSAVELRCTAPPSGWGRRASSWGQGHPCTYLKQTAYVTSSKMRLQLHAFGQDLFRLKAESSQF